MIETGVIKGVAMRECRGRRNQFIAWKGKKNLYKKKTYRGKR